MKAKSEVLEKKAGEIKGSATFDANGKLEVPIKEKSMNVPNEIKDLLNKKEGQKAKQNNKKEAKVREKKVSDPSFRDTFANKAVEQIKGLERKVVDDKLLLKFKRNTIARLMVRANSRFCAYRKNLDGSRATMRVHNEQDENELLNWIAERVEYLKSHTKPKKVPK